MNHTVGLDWAKDAHAVCVVDAAGGVMDRFEARHDSGEGTLLLGGEIVGLLVATLQADPPRDDVAHGQHLVDPFFVSEANTVGEDHDFFEAQVDGVLEVLHKASLDGGFSTEECHFVHPARFGAVQHFSLFRLRLGILLSNRVKNFSVAEGNSERRRFPEIRNAG